MLSLKSVFLVKHVWGQGLEQRQSGKTDLYPLIVIIVLINDIIIYYHYIINLKEDHTSQNYKWNSLKSVYLGYQKVEAFP